MSKTTRCTLPSLRSRAARALEDLLARVPVVVVAGLPGSGRSRLVRAIEPPPLVIDALPADPAAAAVLADWLVRELSGSWRRWWEGARLVVVVGVTGGPVLQTLRQRLGRHLAVLTLRGPSADERRRLAGARWRPTGGPPEPGRLARALLQPVLPGLWPLSLAERREWLAQRLLGGGLRDPRVPVLLCALAARSGEPLSRSALGRVCGVCHATVGAWLEQLHHLGLVLRLDPWPPPDSWPPPDPLPRRLGKRPSWYLADPGLQAGLLGLLEPAALLASPHLERLWRGRLVLELHSLLGADPQAAAAVRLHSWSEQRRTLPLLMEIGGRFWLADSCCRARPHPGDARALRRVAAVFPAERLVALTLVCPCGGPQLLEGGDLRRRYRRSRQAGRPDPQAGRPRPMVMAVPLSRLSETWPVLQRPL